MKPLPQSPQRCGRSPVWMRRCWVRLEPRLKPLPHSTQRCGFSAATAVRHRREQPGQQRSLVAAPRAHSAHGAGVGSLFLVLRRWVLATGSGCDGDGDGDGEGSAPFGDASSAPAPPSRGLRVALLLPRRAPPGPCSRTSSRSIRSTWQRPAVCSSSPNCRLKSGVPPTPDPDPGGAGGAASVGWGSQSASVPGWQEFVPKSRGYGVK